jgi:hypothetical protein
MIKEIPSRRTTHTVFMESGHIGIEEKIPAGAGAMLVKIGPVWLWAKLKVTDDPKMPIIVVGGVWSWKLTSDRGNR